MELNLDLENVSEEDRLTFCEYLVNIIQKIIYESGEQPRYLNMETYINSNGLINWIANKSNYISVYELYRLAAANLNIRKIDENNYEIYLNPNENIPNSYTILYPIISLLEYGTLSVRKCGTLSEALELITKNLDTYYQRFTMENKE